MKIRYSLVILTAASLALSGCSALRGSGNSSSATPAGSINVQTAQKIQAERNALETRVVANGKVIPRQNGIVAFSRAGQVISKTVQLGDVVRAGQLLAKQDTSDLEFSMAQQWQSYINSLAAYSQTIKPVDPRDVLQARSAITAAQASLNNAWAAYNNSQTSIKSAQNAVINAQNGVTTALNAVTTAQNAVTTANTNVASSQNSVQSAQANASSAQTAYGELAKGPSTGTVEAALRSWNAAKNQLWSAQVTRDADCGKQDAVKCKIGEASVGSAFENERRSYQAYQDAQLPTGADKMAQSSASVKSAEIAVKNAETSVQNAQTAVKNAEAGVKTAETGVKSAEVSVRNAELAVQTAQGNSQSAWGNVQSAQVNVENAKIKLDALMNPNNSENTLAAKARLDQSYASWQQAQNVIDKAAIYAPHDGVVTTLNFEIGDFLGSGSKAMEVTAFDRPLFEVDVDEADLANIRVGQDARVLLQSYSQSPISATVEYIAPAATLSGNVTTVKVRLALGQVGFGGGRGGQSQGGGPGARNPAIATAIAQGTPAAAITPQTGGQDQGGGGQGQGGGPGARNPAIATAIAQGTPASALFGQGQGGQGQGGQGQRGGGGQGGGPRTTQIPNIIIGMSGTADIIASRIENALQVPNRALIANRQTRGFGVWRLKADGTAELVTVTTGTRGTSTTQINSGVNEGDTILIPAQSSTGGAGGGFGGGPPGGGGGGPGGGGGGPGGG